MVFSASICLGNPSGFWVPFQQINRIEKCYSVIHITFLSAENGREKISLRFDDSFPGLPLHSIWSWNRDHTTFEVGRDLLRSSFRSSPPVQAGSPNYSRLPHQWLLSVRFWASPGIDSATSLDNLFYTQLVILGFSFRWKFVFQDVPIASSCVCEQHWQLTVSHWLQAHIMQK